MPIHFLLGSLRVRSFLAQIAAFFSTQLLVCGW